MTGYQPSPRVCLEPGDRFRVSGGPYWRAAGGEKITLAARGVFILVEVIRRRRRVYLLAVGRDGYTLLHVEGRRKNREMPSLVCRPYRVRRVGDQKKSSSRRKSA